MNSNDLDHKLEQCDLLFTCLPRAQLGPRSELGDDASFSVDTDSTFDSSLGQEIKNLHDSAFLSMRLIF